MKALIIAAAIIMASSAMAAEPIQFAYPGATCDAVRTVTTPSGSQTISVMDTDGIEKADYLICRVTYPLMTDRFATYGTIKTVKDKTTDTTRRAFDDSQADKLTKAGKGLSQDLMSLKYHGLFALYQSPLQYSSVLIFRYEQVPWDEVAKLLHGPFDAAEKTAKAGE